MSNLTTRALILLGLCVTLMTILSVEATVNDEDDIKSLGHHHEGTPKIVQKRAAEDESSDERHHKRKGRKRKSTTTAPNSTTTAPSSNSTTTTTTAAPSSNSSSTTSSPTSTTSTTTNSPSITMHLNSSPSSSSTTTTPTSTSTTTHSPNASTLASLISGDFNKDPIDIDRMDDLVKNQNEEYELIKKAALSVKEWAKWLHDHHGKSLNPMSAHKYITYVRTLTDYYFRTDTSKGVVALPKPEQPEIIDLDEKHQNRMYPRREFYKLFTKI